MQNYLSNIQDISTITEIVNKGKIIYLILAVSFVIISAVIVFSTYSIGNSSECAFTAPCLFFGWICNAFLMLDLRCLLI